MSIVKLMRSMVMVGAAAISLNSCATSNSTMTTQQLTSVISGNTVYGVDSKGRKFIQIFAYDGQLLSGPADKRDANGKWKPYESGQWKVIDGSLCNTYTKPKVRNAGCDIFYNLGNGVYAYTTPSGGQGKFEKIVAGRSE